LPKFSYYVFSIGKEFRFIDKIEARHGGLVNFKDVNGDGVLKFFGHDWTFAYWNTCFAESPAPTIILKYKEDKYRLDVDLMRKPLPDSEEEKVLAEKLRVDDGWEKKVSWAETDVTPPPEVWRHMLDLIYSGHSDAAWDFLDKVWPKNKSGKEEFLTSFRKQLAKSPYWNLIKASGKIANNC